MDRRYFLGLIFLLRYELKDCISRAAGVLRQHELAWFVFVSVLKFFYGEQRNKKTRTMKGFLQLMTAAFMLNAPRITLFVLSHFGCNDSLWNIHSALNINIKMFSMEQLLFLWEYQLYEFLQSGL